MALAHSNKTSSRSRQEMAWLPVFTALLLATGACAAGACPTLRIECRHPSPACGELVSLLATAQCRLAAAIDSYVTRMRVLRVQKIWPVLHVIMWRIQRWWDNGQHSHCIPQAQSVPPYLQQHLP